MDSLPQKPRLKPATASDHAAFAQQSAPSRTRTLYQLDIPCPLAALGLEESDEGVSHVLLCFETFESAKVMQVRLAATGVHGEIQERRWTK